MQDVTTIDAVRHALFKAVFGSEAFNLLARRRRHGHHHHHGHHPSGGDKPVGEDGVTGGAGGGPVPGPDQKHWASSDSESSDAELDENGGIPDTVTAVGPEYSGFGPEDVNPGGVEESKPTYATTAGGYGQFVGKKARKLSGRGMERMLRAQLAETRALLVLDGCDDVIGTDWMRTLLTKVLRDDKGVHILITCRDPPAGMSEYCLLCIVMQ